MRTDVRAKLRHESFITEALQSIKARMRKDIGLQQLTV